jgi:hypothetical protein
MRTNGASAVVMIGISDPEQMEPLACQEGLALAAEFFFANYSFIKN